MASRNITFIPRVKIAGIPVLDLATKINRFHTIPNLFDVGETISFNFVPTVGAGYAGSNPSTDIKEELIDAVVERLEIAKGEGLGMFQEELDGSPPVIVEIDDIEEWVRNNWGGWGGIDAEFFIARVDNTNHLGNRSANEVQYTKIFLSAPATMAYDSCDYFEADKSNLLTFDWEGKKVDASCGFQYFYQEFSKSSKRKKYVKVGEEREAKVPDGTRFDCSFRKIKWYCENNPPQYDEWYILFREFINENEFDKIQPASEDLIPILEEVEEVKIVDLRNPVYTTLEALNSMSILDIVKLSMWMSLNLLVFDDRDNLVLVYSPEHDYHTKGKKIKRVGGNVVVKIKDNHGFFVKTGDNTKFKFSHHGKHGFGGFYPSAKMGDEWNSRKGKTEDTTMEKDYKIIKHPKAKFKQDSGLNYEWDETDLPENPEPKDWEEARRQLEAPYCKSNPPPLPKELISMMDEPNIYYVGKTKLNGLVDYLHKYHKLKPNNIRGTITCIHKATYNKLKLYAYHQHPNTKYKHPELDELDGDLRDWGGFKSKDGMEWKDELDSSDEEEDWIELEQECIDKWKEDYPELKAYPIPHPSVIGTAVLNKSLLDNKTDCYSRFNQGMKKIFFENEIKPDFRTFNKSNHTNLAFSLDFSKAYTNALKLMDCEWSVFDAVDEPTLFKEFDENCFYLCEELETGFPYKDLKDKGLALYHGCLLRHLVGRVKPRFQIKSFKTLRPDTFAKFAEKCYELAGDGSDNIISAKTLVNTAIGTLKRKGGIKDYKLYVNSDVIQLTKHLASGCPIVSLDDKPRWRGSSFMSAKANKTHHYITGQPIRLQVIDRINELNLLLDRAVRTALQPIGLSYEPRVVMVKTDALYYEYPCEAVRGFKDYFWQKFEWQPDGLDDKVNELLPTGYDVELEHQRVEIDWKEETYNKQLPVQKFRRCWRKQKTYNDAWDKKEGADEIIKFGWDNGGLLVSGEAGTAKTTIIKQLDKLCQRNWIKLRWIKAFYKIVKGDEAPVFINEWMKSNILTIKKYAPTNKACNNIDGMTLHRGLGLQVIGGDIDEGDIDEDEDSNQRMMRVVSKMTTNPPDIIVIDEISMMGGDAWSLLSYIKFRLPQVKFFLFGDIKRQLAPVGEEGRKFDNTAVLKELTNFNKITLKYNFRRNGDSNELWDDWSLRPTKFKVDNKPMTERNLCWTNKTRKEVIDLIQDIHPDANVWLECEVGEDLKNTGQQERLMLAYDTPLIARKSMRDRGVAKNEIWRVYDFPDCGANELVVLNFEDKKETFTYDEIKKNWLSAYCITIHKAQGDTYDDNYTIWDWDRLSKRSDYDARRLRYTAQSRSTKPKELISYK